MSRHIHLHRLKISTRIRLHPEFVTDPFAFAQRYNVALIDDIFPSTDFRKERDTDKKVDKVKSDIHLVEQKAIRLFTDRAGDGDWIRSIDINPTLLLQRGEGHPLTEHDLLVFLTMLLDHVAPVLADPADKIHIVPGLVGAEEHVASWSKIESELLLPDVHLRCLHDLYHPDTGSAEGTTMKRIKLGDRGDCVIHFETAKWMSPGIHGMRETQGTRVRLSLGGNALPAKFAPCGVTASINGTNRLVSFCAPSVDAVLREMMAGLKGTYLPIPPGWAVAVKTEKYKTGNAVRPAKVLALLSALTPIPLAELQDLYEAYSSPSPSTRKRLNRNVPAAVACLRRVPVSSLFLPEAYATQEITQTGLPDALIDPLIGSIYRPNISH